MGRRKGRHWWWLRRRPDGAVVSTANGFEVPPDALQRWDKEAAHKLNRMERHRTKTQLSQRREDDA